MVAGDTTYVKTHTYTEAADFWNSGTAGNRITLQAYPDHSPVIDATGLNCGLNIGAQNYVTVDGFEIRNADTGAYDTRFGISIYNGSYIQVLNCICHHNHDAGIVAAGAISSHLYIENCEFHNNGQSGKGNGLMFYLGGQFSEILNCVSHDNGTAPRNWSSGFEVQTDHVKIHDCETYGNVMAGIDFSAPNAHDCEIYNNKVHHEGGLGINLNAGCYNNLIHHNLVYNNVQDGGWGGGIWISDAGDGNKIYNNVVFGNTATGGDSGGISISRADPHNTVIRNNITSGNTPYALFVYGPGSCEGEDYNCFHELDDGGQIFYNGTAYDNLPAYRAASGFSDYSIAQNPRFVDPFLGDFHLQAGSPCIDAGTDVGLPYEGEAPAMGVYEYGEEVDMPFEAARRNFDGVQFENLRRTLDHRLNQLHDELSAAYYDHWRQGKSQPFQSFDVQATPEESKALFDKLHALIFAHYDILFHEANLAQPVQDRIDEEKYDVVRGKKKGDKTIRYRKSERAVTMIAERAAEGIEITVPGGG